MTERRKRIWSRILSFVLALIMLISSGPLITFAGGSYDRNKACKYAREHWNDGVGKCAEYCSKILKAGGINVPGSVMYRATLLREWLRDNGYGTEHACSYGSDGYVHRSNTKGDLEPGDLVFYYCAKCDDGEPYSIHVVTFSGWDSNGRMKAWSHNKAYNDSSAYPYNLKCYDCGRKITTIHTMHINGGYGSGSASSQPIGCVDECSGGNGTITTQGWCVYSLGQVHIYIGGPAGSASAEGFAVDLNDYRPDVNSVYGTKGNVGFLTTLTTSKRGWQDVYYYGIGGSNPLIAKERVYINEAKTPYSITFTSNPVTLYVGETYNLSFQVAGTGLAQVGGSYTNGKACSIAFNSISGAGPYTVKGTIKGTSEGTSVLTVYLKNSAGKVEYSKNLTINVKRKAKQIKSFRAASISNVTYRWYMTYFYYYKREPKVYDSASGTLLKKGTDYTLSYKIGSKSYSDYTRISFPSGSKYLTVTVTIKGKGSYSNVSGSTTYRIVK